MPTIENEYLKVSVNTKGGSLTSIFDKKKGKETLYQPIKESWQGQDVFIFPFVARLKEQTYTYKNKEYHLKNHGLIRYMTGEEKKSDESHCQVCFHSDESTLEQYPFPFNATASYELVENRLIVTYTIENLSDERMPYMVGGHPAFLLPGTRKETEFDISGNYVTFPEKLNLIRITQDETCSFNIQDEEFASTDRIDLSKKMFEKINTYIFRADNMDSITLHKTDGSTITLEKKEIKYLALWSGNEYGNFIAMEPWNGVPDYLTSSYDILTKKGIEFLDPHKKTTFSYSILIK
jgi:galactose mutarotase-like enzyme